MSLRWISALFFIMYVTLCCGRKSDESESGGDGAFVPAGWDGSTDYSASTWEILTP